MEKLTLDKAIEQKFSIGDCVRYYKPDASDEYVDYIIWEETCYPFDMKICLDQLYHLFISGAKDERSFATTDK